MPAKTPVVTIEPCYRINRGRQFGFGPGKAELLEHIAETGSIREAATRMGMSYMRAWTLVKKMDTGLAEPVVRKERGGSSGGGAALTETGLQLLATYRALEVATARVTKAFAQRFEALASASPKKKTRRTQVPGAGS